MDASRFDAWTRRRFGLLTGGLAASLLGAASLADVEAKKKKKKKKCKKLQAKCSPGSKKKRCCSGISCEEFPPNGFFCCHNIGESCSDLEDCCGLTTVCVEGLCAEAT